MPTTRILTDREARTLSLQQQDYLKRNPHIVCLQPWLYPSDALYATVRHGAVTIDRAIELDELHNKYLAQQAERLTVRKLRAPVVVSDEWAQRDERCIDQFGCSSILW